jgi:hypothetical protein
MNFNPITSPRRWGPKARQSYAENAIDGLATGSWEAGKMAGKRCK